MLKNLTEQLRQSEPLVDAQVFEAVAQLIDENISTETKADFLTALSQKGETVEELAAFARELREKSIQPKLDAETRSREILDVCGTGGDHLNTFNISTTVALLVASAGVTVAKHGNRAVTSQSGSADVLEALGIRIDLTAEQAAECLQKHHFAFFFAPKFHPAFKHIAPARKLCAQRGQRTIFNLMGPLLNPARPTAQLIGVPNPKFCEPMAKVLQMLGVRRGMVVSGKIGTSNIQHRTSNTESSRAENSESRVSSSELFLDEFSTLGENFLAEFYQERGFSCSTISPENFPLQPVSLADLGGADSKSNAEITRRIFSGDERGPKRDAVLLNSAAALLVAGKVKNLSDGWDLAAQLIDNGSAEKKLKELALFSAEGKP
ncbi:MAG: anthranilate phosphoribosyltransferase [Verrucomicrobiota bacterium]